MQTPDGARLEVDLCDKHAAPLQAAVKLGRPGRVTRKIGTEIKVTQAKPSHVPAAPAKRGRPRKTPA